MAWSDRLEALERHVESLRRQLEDAERDLREHHQKRPDEIVHESNRLAPEEKIRLFRSLFVGRSDVYARRWENLKTGKAGYSPACANEWARGVCEKPRVRCAQCPSRDFLPLDDSVLKTHLVGRIVAGVYPLNAASETIFLAMDFDGDAWRRDARAVIRAARDLGVPFALERSRSGEGAHLWIFFEEPVPASRARLLGFQLLSAAMDHEHRLPLTSYDRLFPNQDSMPEGGFGNLIALPLQRQAREQGNTLFLDDDLQLIADPWAFLASLARVSHARLEEWIGASGSQRPAVDDSEEEEPSPWLRSPSRIAPLMPVLERPKALIIVRAQMLFVEREGLSSPILMRLKRLAMLPNPEFRKREAMRLSVSGTPRVIRSFEDEEQHIALPRGCEEGLLELAAELGVEVSWDDRTVEGQPLSVSFSGEFREGQGEAVGELASHRLGVLVAPPGAGKTVMAASLIARRGRNTLIIVHRQPLLEQWRARLSQFLGLDPRDIGVVAAGKNSRNGRIDIAMVQSLVRDTGVADWIAEYGMVVVDECHHVPAASIEKVLKEVKARCVYGLTATPRRKDGLQRVLHFHCGPVRHVISETSEVAGLGRILDLRETGFAPLEEAGVAGIQAQFSALAEDDARTRRIVVDVARLVERGFHPLVLTERVEHLGLLEGLLRERVGNVVALRGGGTAKQRKACREALEGWSDQEPWAVVATGRYIGEGFDEPRLDALVLAMPISWKGTLIQYAGRILRHYEGKARVMIVDYVDDGALLRSMARKRRVVWHGLGFRPETMPSLL